MAAWPATLPDFAYTMSGSFGEGRRVTPSDSGRVQAHVISGAPPWPISVENDYTGTQMGTLAEFYFDTLEGGVLPFTHVHIFTSVPATYQFKPDAPPPQFNHLRTQHDGGARTGWIWRVQFTLLWLS